MKKLIIFPTVFEASSVFKYYHKKPKLGEVIEVSDELKILISGIGCETSKKRVKKIAEEFKPQALVLIGYCGACSESLKNGDFVFECNSKVFHDTLNSLKAFPVKIACVEKTADKKKKFELAKNGFDAVEMEQDFFEPIAKRIGANFIHIRCVSDSKKSSIPSDLMDLTMCKNSGDVNPIKILSFKRILKNPSILLKLIYFGIEIAPVQKLFAKRSIEIIKKIKELNTL